MLGHPAYPSRALSSAFDRAIDRDLRDSERLALCETIILTALDILAPAAHDLEHPDAAWHPGDLMDVLADQLANVRAEQQRVRSFVVVGDE